MKRFRPELLCLALFAGMAVPGYSQQNFIPPSPEVAAQIRNINIPVSPDMMNTVSGRGTELWFATESGMKRCSMRKSTIATAKPICFISIYPANPV